MTIDLRYISAADCVYIRVSIFSQILVIGPEFRKADTRHIMNVTVNHCPTSYPKSSNIDFGNRKRAYVLYVYIFSSNLDPSPLALLQRFRDIAAYTSKINIFPTPLTH